MLHGVFLAFHKMMLGDNKPDSSWPTTASGWLVDVMKIIATFHLVGLTWILFRAPSFGSAMVYIKGILAGHDLLDLRQDVLIAAALILVLDIIQTHSGNHTWLLAKPRSLRYGIAQIMIFCSIAAAVFNAQTVVPFIYFQF